MTELQDLDMPAIMAAAMGHVFQSLMSISPEPMAAIDKSAIQGERISGSVSFAGKASGIICIHLGDNLARHLTAMMLGLDPEDLEGMEEVKDAIGELSNMIGGNIKSRLCDKGFTCMLSIPSILVGKDFRIACLDKTFRYQSACSLGKDFFVIEAFIRRP